MHLATKGDKLYFGYIIENEYCMKIVGTISDTHTIKSRLCYKFYLIGPFFDDECENASKITSISLFYYFYSPGSYTELLFVIDNKWQLKYGRKWNILEAKIPQTIPANTR